MLLRSHSARGVLLAPALVIGIFCNASNWCVCTPIKYRTRHQHAHHRRHHESARPAAAVAEAMEPCDGGVELVVHLDLVAVKFELRRVKQRFVAGEPGHHFVHRLDEVDDVGHRAVRHGGCDVARDSVLEGGTDVGHAELPLPGAFAREDVAVALHEDLARAQHICELAHLLRVLDRLIERLIERVRAQDGEVGVLALELLIAVPVDDGEVVVVVLLRHEAAGVLAEDADFVLERRGIADEFGLVQHAVDLFHDLVAHLYPDADVHYAGSVGDVVHRTHLLQPVRAAAAGGDDGLVREQFARAVLRVLDDDALADVLLKDDVVALRAEYHLHAVVAEVVLYGEVYPLRLFRAHVAYGTVHQLQPGFDGFAADLLHLFLVAEPLNVLVRAEFEVDLVRVVDEFLREIVPDEFGQFAAHFIGERKFAVRERARARKARRDVAVRFAVAAGTAVSLGTFPPLDGLPFFDNDDLFSAAVSEKLYCGEYPRGTCADYTDVVLFHDCLRARRFPRRDLVHYKAKIPPCQRENYFI